MRFPGNAPSSGFTPPLPDRYRDAYFLQLSKIIVPLNSSDRNVSAPGGAQCRSGVGPAKKTRKQNKKPGDERRANPSLPLAPVPCALGRMCSKLVFFLSGVRNQPHLWMSRQARSVSRLPRESGLHQLPYSIGSIQIPVKGHSRFLHLAVAFPCEFHRQVVEIDFILRCALQVFSCASRATCGNRVGFRSVKSHCASGESRRQLGKPTAPHFGGIKDTCLPQIFNSARLRKSK